MNKLFSLLAAISLAVSASAQTGGKITGSIKDGGNQKVIDAASISLLKANDSSLVKSALTDPSGNYIFENVKEGDYLVMASSVGHSKTYSKAFKLAKDAELKLDPLQLIVSSKSLKEVVVTSKKPMIERKADKTVVNVDASITNTGSTALEVLEKAPGVTVDKDGNISLKGKQGVMIMLDGKPTYLSSADLTNMLRNMPASSLDQVEIMTNPSARYDASGKSGIINIKTKKNKQKGFNGNLTAAYGQGVYSRTNNSLNLNYRTGKFNIFGNFSGNYRNNFQNIDIKRYYSNDDKSLKAIFEQNSYRVRHNGNYNAKLGADFYLSPKTTIGVVFTGITSPETENGINTSYLKNKLNVVDSVVVAESRDEHQWRNGAVNLNFRHQFDSTGREITADFDYLRYRSVNAQDFLNTTYNSDWSLKSNDELTGELPSGISIYSGKIDYVHPFKKSVKLEAGIKSSFVETDNTAGYYNVVGGVKYADYEKTNRFDYKENINAGYINLSQEIKKWTLQAGLRLENTNYKGHQFGNPMKKDSSFSKSYTSLFPTFYLGYNASEKHQFGFSYGRRINRPDYEDLNPFLFFLDKYTYGAGNPFLKPQYSDILELNHTYNQFLTTTLNYSHTRDLFNETFEQSGFATIVRQGNYGYMNDLSLSVSAQVPVAKWWSANIYAEGKYNQFKGRLYGEDLDVNGTTGLVNITNQFTFKKGWSAEISGFYRTSGIDGQIKVNPLGQLNAGIQKQLLKNKATLKLSARDILATQRPTGSIQFQNTDARFHQYSDNTSVSVSFTYRFGKPIKGAQKRHTGGAGDEQNRVKNGGN